jgi:hypothetical protein
MDTTQLRETWLKLKPQVEKVAGELAALKRTTARLASEEGYEALRKLQKDIAAVEAMTLSSEGLVGQVHDALRPVHTWLDEEWGRRSVQFAEELHRFFADREVRLTGVPPKLDAGPLTIEFDTRQDQARILYAGEPIREKIPLAPARVFREWQAACQQLDKNVTAPGELFDAIADAYETARKIDDTRPGGRVRLSNVHFQLFVARQTVQVKQDPRKGKIKEYPRFQFAYDLALLLQSPEGLVRKGKAMTIHIAARSAAESRSLSIMLPDGRGGWAHYSDVQVDVKGNGR